MPKARPAPAGERVDLTYGAVAYAGERFLTGSDIAHALIRYAQALASAGEADAVSIPTVDLAGEPGSAVVLVGPASQLVATRVHADLDEPSDPELVATLQRKTAELNARTSSIAGPYVEEPPVDDPSYSDWDL